MTDEEVLEHIRTDSPLNKLRRLFSSCCGRIEQAMAQKHRPSAIEYRKMEFEAVQELIEAIKKGEKMAKYYVSFTLEGPDMTTDQVQEEIGRAINLVNLLDRDWYRLTIQPITFSVEKEK